VDKLKVICIQIPKDVTVKNIDNLKEAVDEKLQKNLNQNQKVVFDFQKVQFIDSSGITFLIEVCRRLQDNGCYIKAHHISEEVSSILDILGVDDLLKK
jgi:anti-anti-sigma factor